MLLYPDTRSFYARVQQNGLTSKAEQWGSMATCDQYRLAYAKTSQHVQPGTRCLDWGSGNGHFSYFLTQNGFQTDAYSFQEPPAFLMSSPLFKHTLANPKDPVTIPYPDETFDNVFSVGVLEHVHESGGEQRKTILELVRILKKGGTLLIYHLPNRYTWIEFLVRSLNRLKGKTMHEHSYFATRRSFMELIQGTSLEVLEGGRYNFIPRNSFNRLPHVLTNNALVCSGINAVDSMLAAVCPVLCQNWYFILRKK